jgi:hypothetical protein
MRVEHLAKQLAESLARHQSRGLVDDASGLTDVVIHGHVDLTAVTKDILDASIAALVPARKSWGAWFISKAETRRRASREARELENLAERLERARSAAEAAIIRLKSREMGS